ncbi:hypothetical protein EHE19_019330 [Ruminiclostridium herbifermentans]|uniref:Uncharacterized protein n=1 Tax=Ruminiclostridium herbifermentans TaxID=2488810 RepID=A0A4U7JAS4_9FIRM|nr:hypothetical protein [Ruminiclostridium herbifermentans]QNU66948.1 hypothetical protein EHE19_019330 [Ruminiclostridium herbifermentans]
MNDTFNIEYIDKFCNVQELEISDISKIIKQMISIKNDLNHKSKKRNKPYDIIDKIILNKFSENNKEKIKKYHLDSFDIVEDALSCLAGIEASIINDLFDYYWEIYTSILIKLNININDDESIKENVDSIYLALNEKIYEQIFAGKKSDIEINKRITYINAISAYVFYQCKILIPIESTDSKSQ